MKKPLQYILKSDGTFPNSTLPVLHYKKLLKLPILFPAATVKRLFSNHNWSNNWRDGIYTFAHYHSVTHEVMGVIKGKTRLQLGGDKGITITINEGDIIIIPAGVAHKNLGKEKDVICVGGYPNGKDFDMNYGFPEEQPKANKNIASLPIPSTDPVFDKEGLPTIWNKNKKRIRMAISGKKARSKPAKSNKKYNHRLKNKPVKKRAMQKK